MLAAVDMRAEGDAVIGDLAQPGQAEDLIAAAVGQYRPVPAHVPMQPSQVFDGIYTRPQVKMIGVAQDYGYAYVFKLFRDQGLDRALAGYGKESRRRHRAVPGIKLSQPCLRLRTGLYYLKMLVYLSNPLVF